MDLRTAAERLGVHYQTAYRWVRDGSLPAVKVGSSYLVDEAALERFRAARTRPAPPPRRTTVRSWDPHVDRVHRLLAEGDELEARQLVDRLREGGIEPVELCEQLLVPALRRIGEDWAAGRVSVAVEHRASAICERILARMVVHPRGRPRGTAVVTSCPGEEHGLPGAMATVALRADRWQVHHLGTQVPADDLVRLVHDDDVDLVVLTVTNPSVATATEAIAARVRSETNARCLVGRPDAPLRELVEAARR